VTQFYSGGAIFKFHSLNKMHFCFISIALLLSVAALVNGDLAVSLTSLNHFLKTPSTSIQTGGRLTERQIAYIAQNGYRSLLSVVQFTTNDTSFNGVNGTYPSTDYEMTIAESYGMAAKYVVTGLTAPYAYIVSDLIKAMPAPVFVHCHVSSFRFFVQLNFYFFV
jgi:hypothetical protein